MFDLRYAGGLADPTESIFVHFLELVNIKLNITYLPKGR